MPLTTQSILRTDLPAEEIDRLVTAALNQLELISEREFQGKQFTIRDLVPSDLPGFTNNEFLETSGADNAYATTTGGNGTSIADDTILMIWGISILTEVTTPTVTVFRFTVGASLRAQVSLYGITPLITTGTSVGSALPRKIGYLMTPIGVTKQTPLTIEEYTIEATTAYIPEYIGAVAEVQGRTIEA